MSSKVTAVQPTTVARRSLGSSSANLGGCVWASTKSSTMVASVSPKDCLGMSPRSLVVFAGCLASVSRTRHRMALQSIFFGVNFCL